MQELTFVIDKLEQLGMVLTEKTLEGFAYLWPLAVRQVYVEILKEGLASLILLALAIASGNYIITIMRHEEPGGDAELLVLVLVFVLIACVTFGIPQLFSAVGKALNVEYHSIKILHSLIRSVL